MSKDSTSEVREPPYTYECTDCGARVEEDTQPVACPECDGEMRNISKPREQ